MLLNRCMHLSITHARTHRDVMLQSYRVQAGMEYPNDVTRWEPLKRRSCRSRYHLKLSRALRFSFVFRTISFLSILHFHLSYSLRYNANVNCYLQVLVLCKSFKFLKCNDAASEGQQARILLSDRRDLT